MALGTYPVVKEKVRFADAAGFGQHLQAQTT
jgi:hypothetical protein